MLAKKRVKAKASIMHSFSHDCQMEIESQNIFKTHLEKIMKSILILKLKYMWLCFCWTLSFKNTHLRIPDLYVTGLTLAEAAVPGSKLRSGRKLIPGCAQCAVFSSNSVLIPGSAQCAVPSDTWVCSVHSVQFHLIPGCANWAVPTDTWLFTVGSSRAFLASTDTDISRTL